MASCEQPEKDDGVSANGGATAEVHSDTQPPELATPSPSWKVVAIPCLRENLDSYDVGTALHQKSGAMTDVTLHRFSHLNSEKVVNCAITSLPASTEIAEIEVHVGLPSYPVITLFSEESTATFSLNRSLFTEHMVEYIQRQANKLKLDIRFDSQTYRVKASGSCRQIHKFQEYLTSLAVHQLHLNPAHFLLNTAAPLEQPGATGTSSPGDEDPSGENSYGNFSPDVLVLMPKLKEIPGLKYFPEEGRVEVAGVSSEEREKIISKFQETYQNIVTNRQLKTYTLELPPTSKAKNIAKLLLEFNEKYHQCHFSYNSISHSVKIVSISTRQFEQAKKLLKDRIAGKSSSMVSMPNESSSSQEVLVLPHSGTVTVKRGNIVEEEADVIVNAANSKLMHWGGVASALDKASNGELQKHSDQYTSTYGEVPAGEAVITQAGGRLRCKYVVHAVGPIAGIHKSETLCRQLIYDAIKKSLRNAQLVKAMSIVLPALSTGVYAVDPSLSAQAMLNAINQFDYPKDLLKDIRIVILDKPTYSCFAQELLRFKAVHMSSNTEETGVSHLERSLSDPSGTNLPKGETFSAKEFLPETSKSSTVEKVTTGNDIVTTQPMSTQPCTVSPNAATSSVSVHSGPPGLSAGTSYSSSGALTITTWGNDYKAGSITTPAVTSTGAGGLPPVSGASASATSSTSSNGSFLRPSPLNGSTSKALLQPSHFSLPSSNPGMKPYPSANTAPHASKNAVTNNECPICLCDITHPIYSPCCKQGYCKKCLDKALQHSPYCPTCKKALKAVQGPQPPGGKMSWYIDKSRYLSGYSKCGTISITYNIPGGTQGPQHPNPGHHYTGTIRTAYLPDNNKGRQVLQLLKRAFDAGLTFTVGTSTTTGKTNTVVWNDIHHKTNTTGGPTCYGYPDDTYLQRVTEELKAKGIY